MRNLLFRASFDGSAFHGWQIQKDLVTVQGTLKKAFYELTGEQANIIGCSRTDAGVHANEYYFSVKTESNIPCESFPIAFRTKLPGEISVSSCREVSADFNARFSCESKEYRYVIDNSPFLSPFLYHRAYWHKYPLNIEEMKKAAGFFVGTYDYSAFCAAGAQVVSKVRTVYSAEITTENNQVIFTVCGNGFLYNMVRIMAGTLLYVGAGKIKAEEIPSVIESKDRVRAGLTLPPDGLYLNKVRFGGESVETEIEGT